jgi:hemoglobin-like flavoprotein
MSHADLLERSLEQVVERVGDPAPLVYQRLFERSPELLPMFVGDTRGSVRAEMFLRAIDTLTDLAGERHYAAGMIASEWSNHTMNGVTTRQFESFFEIIVEVCQQALGTDWTPEIDAAWRSTIARVIGVTAAASAGG